MFRLPEVQAIICARGGYGSNYLLPHLNLTLIAQNPKILCGYSDITTLLTYFHDTLGLVGFHGPMLVKDFARCDGVDWRSFCNASAGRAPWRITSSDTPTLAPILTGTCEGKLEKVRGIIFGEMMKCAPSPDTGYTLQQIIARIVADLDLKIPVAYGLRSGHVSGANITLPIGTRAQLSVAETVILDILEAATVARAETNKAGQN